MSSKQSPYITGYNTPEQARVCMEQCEHCYCVVNGEAYRGRDRCALEKWITAKAKVKAKVEVEEVVASC